MRDKRGLSGVKQKGGPLLEFRLVWKIFKRTHRYVIFLPFFLRICFNENSHELETRVYSLNWKNKKNVDLSSKCMFKAAQQK